MTKAEQERGPDSSPTLVSSTDLGFALPKCRGEHGIQGDSLRTWASVREMRRQPDPDLGYLTLWSFTVSLGRPKHHRPD